MSKFHEDHTTNRKVVKNDTDKKDIQTVTKQNSNITETRKIFSPPTIEATKETCVNISADQTLTAAVNTGNNQQTHSILSMVPKNVADAQSVQKNVKP